MAPLKSGQMRRLLLPPQGRLALDRGTNDPRGRGVAAISVPDGSVDLGQILAPLRVPCRATR